MATYMESLALCLGSGLSINFSNRLWAVAGFFPWFKGPPLNLLPGGCRYGLLITDLDNDHVDPTTPLPPTTTATSHHWSQPPPRANPLPFTHY